MTEPEGARRRRKMTEQKRAEAPQNYIILEKWHESFGNETHKKEL